MSKGVLAAHPLDDRAQRGRAGTAPRSGGVQQPPLAPRECGPSVARTCWRGSTRWRCAAIRSARRCCSSP